MPRYRFSWSNLPASLLRRLSVELQLSGSPDAALRATYGARPRVDFIRDAWPVLLESWLSSDRPRSRSVARRLRELNLGNPADRDDNSYLAGLRNTANLRQVVLDAFIEFGEQSSEDRSTTVAISSPTVEVGPRFAPPSAEDRRSDFAARGEQPADETPAPEAANENEEQVAPDDAEEQVPSGEEAGLFAFVAGVMVDLMGEGVFLDNDGDFVVPLGSSVTYVQVLTEPEAVRLYSPLVVDVAPSPRVFELCNSINTKLLVGRLVYTNEAIVLEHVLLPMGLSGEEVSVALRMLATAADYFDHRLQSELGGRIAQPERAEDEIDV